MITVLALFYFSYLPTSNHNCKSQPARLVNIASHLQSRNYEFIQIAGADQRNIESRIEAKQILARYYFVVVLVRYRTGQHLQATKNEDGNGSIATNKWKIIMIILLLARDEMIKDCKSLSSRVLLTPKRLLVSQKARMSSQILISDERVK